MQLDARYKLSEMLSKQHSVIERDHVFVILEFKGGCCLRSSQERLCQSMGSVCDLAVGLRRSKAMSRLSYAQNKSICLESALCRDRIDRVRAASGLKLTRVRGALCAATRAKDCCIFICICFRISTNNRSDWDLISTHEIIAVMNFNFQTPDQDCRQGLDGSGEKRSQRQYLHSNCNFLTFDIAQSTSNRKIQRSPMFSMKVNGRAAVLRRMRRCLDARQLYRGDLTSLCGAE